MLTGLNLRVNAVQGGSQAIAQIASLALCPSQAALGAQVVREMRIRAHHRNGVAKHDGSQKRMSLKPVSTRHTLLFVASP